LEKLLAFLIKKGEFYKKGEIDSARRGEKQPKTLVASQNLSQVKDNFVGGARSRPW
jgi:hypothetical protein